MSFMEAALGSGASPLVCIDGPTAEIKRHIRKALSPDNAEWNGDAIPYQYTLGFGLQKLTEKGPKFVHPEQDPTDKFQGHPHEMLEWVHDACACSIDKDDKLNLWLFIFDVGPIADDFTYTSMLAHITDGEGVGIRTSTTIILCGPGIIHDLPAELREQCVKLTCPRPDADEIKGLITNMYMVGEETPPKDAELDRMAREAAGMTASEVSNVGARSIYEHSKIVNSVMREEVRNMLLDLPGVDLLDTDNFTLDMIGGYSAVKHSMISLIGAYETKTLVSPKGVVLSGPPGTGKSALARAIGNKVGWKVLMVSPSEFKDKFVGETGKNMSKLISIAEALAPCIIVLDEVDGAFGTDDGSKESSSSGDMLTIFLTWQAQEREKPIFVVATCNRLDKLPPEFSRAGRFDKRFFMDVPSKKAKLAIWKHYLTKFSIIASQEMPEDTDWTGAEIESCVQIAYIEDLSLVAAAKQIVPIVSQMGDNFLKGLRSYAAKSCLDSETGERYIAVKGTVKAPPPVPGPGVGGGATIKKKAQKK